MPLHPAQLSPPFHIVRVAYVMLGCTDLDRSRAFWVDTLGYATTEEVEGDALYLRGYEERNHHSIVLKKSSTAEVIAVGFNTLTEDDLDRAAAFCSARGLQHGFVDRSAQGRTLSFVDPIGMRVDLFHQMNETDCLLRKYGSYSGARIQRIDHVNCFTPDVQSSYDFYNALGFRPTEYTVAEDGEEIWAIWLHRKGNVHDLAFTNGMGPRLHHVGVWVNAVTDIIHICDVLSTTGWLPSMERGPGRHGISNAFFLYLRDPDGHRIELFTSDYLTIDPSHKPIRWSLRDPQRQTLWGAPAPKSWFEEGSPFSGIPPRPSRLIAAPIVAPL
jgi:catechol 2,3-dioxygenase